MTLCGTACVLLVFLLGCDGAKPDEPMGGKVGYETAAADLKEAVATVAAFQPYLHQEEDKTAYAPTRRADEIKQAFYAATEIRHAANRARQKADRSTSSVTKELVPTFEKLNKACTNPEDMDDVAKCDAEVKALDAVLQDHASKSSAAGATGTFPRVVPEAITDAAKASRDRFKKAMGPTEQEIKYLATRADKSISPQDLITACQTAANTANEVMNEFQKAGDPELQKLAAIHKLSLDSQCNKLTMTDSLLTGLGLCTPEEIKKRPKPPPGEEESDECQRVCAQSKTQIDKGIPAAAFEKFPEAFAESCEENGKLKEKK